MQYAAYRFAHSSVQQQIYSMVASVYRVIFPLVPQKRTIHARIYCVWHAANSKWIQIGVEGQL